MYTKKEQYPGWESCTPLVDENEPDEMKLGIPFFAAIYTEFHFNANSDILEARIDFVPKY